MLQTVYSAGISGVDGFPVTVECNCANRLAKFELVGLPDASVKEAKERIKTAIENSGYDFPEADITVNLAPADRKKQGSGYDLAILVGILFSAGFLPNGDALADCCFIGELSLSGDVRGVHGVLSMCLAAREAQKNRVFVPAENAGEASVVDGIQVFPVSSVKDLIRHLRGEQEILPRHFDRMLFDQGTEIFDYDFSDVKGQEKAKRALEIAAAGGHNVLLIGPPGTGKSMLAKRIPSILPPLYFEEAVETTKLHSAAGILPDGVSLLTARPFRAPHHTLSPVSLAGGGSIPMPGEISLAHNGVLFLDELPEFSKQSTEVLRQPLEDRMITITRASGRVSFPCSFMLVCAMNPCRCGYFGAPGRVCTCREADIKNYMKRISGPLLDRIDIQIEVPALSFDTLNNTAKGESSSVIRERVVRARQFSSKRYEKGGDVVRANAALSSRQIRTYCVMTDSASALLKNAFDKMGLSARGYDRILRVARTIADMDESDTIDVKHLAEAIQLRSLDRKYW